MDVLFQDGRLLGQLDSTGTVTGVIGIVGSVDTMGIVYDHNGVKVGDVDSVGMLRFATGELAGLVDTRGVVWQGDTAIGQTVGSEPQRAGAAIRFLLQGMPTAEYNATPPKPTNIPDYLSDGLHSSSQEEPIHSRRRKRSRPGSRGAIILAHFLLLLPLGMVGWGALVSGKWVIGQLPPIMATLTKPPPGVAIPDSRPMPTTTPKPISSLTANELALRADPLKEKKRAIAHLYQKMSNAFPKKGLPALYAHNSPGWTLRANYTDIYPTERSYQVYEEMMEWPNRNQYISGRAMHEVKSIAGYEGGMLAEVRLVVTCQYRVNGKRRLREIRVRRNDFWISDGKQFRCAKTYLDRVIVL